MPAYDLGMAKLIDLTDQRFGRLIAVRREVVQGRTDTYWFCRCDCGTEKLITAGNLRRGLIQSCGCLHSEITRRRSTRHGAASGGGMTSEYRIWIEMRQRCTNPKSNRYYSHGGRGIKVCKRWEKFETFLNDMGARPKGTQLDRRNNDGDYKPSNCRWATRKEQARNKRNNRLVTVKGETKPLAQWCEELNLPYSRILARLNTGWTPEEAFELAASP